MSVFSVIIFIGCYVTFRYKKNSNRPKKAGLIFIIGAANILLFRKVVWQKAF